MIGKGLVLLASVVLGAAFSLAAELDTVAVKVIGDVQYRVGAQGAWQRLAEKATLQPDTFVQTAEKSSVTIVLGQRGVITVHELSTMQLVAAKTAPGGTAIELSLLWGRIWSRFKKGEGQDSSGLTIRTPAAVASVRGTSFFVQSDKEKKDARIGVWDGTVGVAAAANTRQEKAVPAGYEIIVLYNQPLVDPRKMEMETLREQQRFNEAIEALGLASLFPGVRGMAEMNETALNDASKTVTDARVRQKGTAIVDGDFKKIKLALLRLYADTGYYPGKGANKISGRKQLPCLRENQDAAGNPIPGWKGPYMDSDFKDPFGGPYSVYLKNDRFLMLCSLGLDQAPSDDDIEDVYSLKKLEKDAEDLKQPK